MAKKKPSKLKGKVKTKIQSKLDRKVNSVLKKTKNIEGKIASNKVENVKFEATMQALKKDVKDIKAAATKAGKFKESFLSKKDKKALKKYRTSKKKKVRVR